MGISYQVYERRLRALLGFWILCFAVVGLIQIISPAALIAGLNQLGTWLQWPGPLLEATTNRFYSSLSVSLLVILTLLAHTARHNAQRRLPAVRIIIVSKLVSTVGYLAALGWETRAFAYLAAALADGFVAVWTYLYYRRVRVIG